MPTSAAPAGASDFCGCSEGRCAPRSAKGPEGSGASARGRGGLPCTGPGQPAVQAGSEAQPAAPPLPPRICPPCSPRPARPFPSGWQQPPPPRRSSEPGIRSPGKSLRGRTDRCSESPGKPAPARARRRRRRRRSGLPASQPARPLRIHPSIHPSTPTGLAAQPFVPPARSLGAGGPPQLRPGGEGEAAGAGAASPAAPAELGADRCPGAASAAHKRLQVTSRRAARLPSAAGHGRPGAQPARKGARRRGPAPAPRARPSPAASPERRRRPVKRRDPPAAAQARSARRPPDFARHEDRAAAGPPGSSAALQPAHPSRRLGAAPAAALPAPLPSGGALRAGAAKPGRGRPLFRQQRAQRGPSSPAGANGRGRRPRAPRALLGKGGGMRRPRPGLGVSPRKLLPLPNADRSNVEYKSWPSRSLGILRNTTF